MKDSQLPEVKSKLLNPGDILQDSLLSLHNLSERNFPALKQTKNSTAGTGSHTLSEMRSRYRIIRSLGFVGFSRTYLLAEDLNRFNQRCVLKEFAPQLQGIEAIAKAQELFEHEAGVFSRLQHPQVSLFRQLFGCKQDREYLFLVRDYVAGETYRTLLDRRIKANLKFSEAEIKQLLIDVLAILEYIHSMGVIHRDISPDNLILRDRDRLPVLINFGCIKEIELKIQSELSNATIPSIATAINTDYAPPEQVERGIVYAHSDLYALAATTVVLLTGKEPQQINSNDYRWQWQSEVISPKLEWVLNTMLSPYPSNRFSSATEVIKTLQNISAIAIVRPTQTDPQLRFQQQRLTEKMSWTGNLLSKSWFFVPFTAVLILGGYFCLMVAKLKLPNPVFDNNFQENIQQ